MIAAPPGLKQPQRRAVLLAHLACFVDKQCGDTLNISSNAPPPAEGEGTEGGGRKGSGHMAATLRRGGVTG